PHPAGEERELPSGGRRADPGVPPHDVHVVRGLPHALAFQRLPLLDELAGDVEPLQGQGAHPGPVGHGEADDAHREQEQARGADQRLVAAQPERLFHGHRQKGTSRAEWTKIPSARPSPEDGSYARRTKGGVREEANWVGPPSTSMRPVVMRSGWSRRRSTMRPSSSRRRWGGRLRGGGVYR